MDLGEEMFSTHKRRVGIPPGCGIEKCDGPSEESNIRKIHPTSHYGDQLVDTIERSRSTSGRALGLDSGLARTGCGPLEKLPRRGRRLRTRTARITTRW
ncbi:hypothetical protein VTK73DRAFT_6767 [Phialemonium thermophilum]|uniref:Uncharacterized protein n=1 Tax=Phialemonium thermophilum TaxID=223376 RepID=A0ABR3WI58_9PEZI